MNQGLIAAAKGVIDNLDRMREVLPNLADDHLIVVAKAIQESEKTKSPPEDLPSTLPAAMRLIFEESGGQVRTKDLVSALQSKGWSRLSNGAYLNGQVGRVLKKDPQFVPTVRGTWQLASHTEAERGDVAPSPSELDADCERVLKVLRDNEVPMLAKEVAETLKEEVYWVVTRLKKLHVEGKVRSAQKHSNGTAQWVITS